MVIEKVTEDYLQISLHHLRQAMGLIGGGQCHCDKGICVWCEDCQQCVLYKELINGGVRTVP